MKAAETMRDDIWLFLNILTHNTEFGKKKKKCPTQDTRRSSKRPLECDTGNFIPLAETITNLLTHGLKDEMQNQAIRVIVDE